MYSVEVYNAVRRYVFIEGHSRREAARQFGISRETARKICCYAEPPGYQRRQPVHRPKLDPFTGIIDQILADDLQVHGKQQHTAKRIFERLRDEHGFEGGYTTVKDYVRDAQVRTREMFVPLLHPPGHAQVDFGEALAIIGGTKRKIHFFCFDLPQSDACFVKAYPAETTEAFLDGHVSARRNFMVPLPRAADFDELNGRLHDCCLRRQADHAGRHRGTIGGRLARDVATLRALPAAPFEACETRAAKVSSTSLVRYRGNDYSVPTAYGYRDVLVKGFVHEVVICHGSKVIARHRRSYEPADFVFDPLHYLALLEHKTGALDQAAPLAGWDLPEQFGHLRRLLEARMDKRGRREFVQVLRLLEVFPKAVVAAAVTDSIRLGAISFDAVKQLALCRLERRPARLDLAAYPHLPKATVRATAAGDYMALLDTAAVL